MSERIGPKIRTALDIEEPSGINAPDIDKLESSRQNAAQNWVNVKNFEETQIGGIQKKFEEGSLKSVSPEQAEILFAGCPGLEEAQEEDKSTAAKRLNQFLDAYGVASNVGSVHQAAAQGGGKSINPVNIGVDALKKASQTAGSVVGNTLAGASIISNFAGAVNSTVQAVERSDVLNTKQRILKELESKMQGYIRPNNMGSNGYLASEINYPQDSALGLHEMLFEALCLAEKNEQKRIARASINAIGNGVSTLGGAMAIAGSAGAGIGAIPGLVVGAVGAGVSLSTSAWQLFNYAVKRIAGIKGVDREAASKLIWGLALMHKDSGAVDRHTARDIEEDPMNLSESPVKDALYLANACQNANLKFTTQEQRKLAREKATEYWEDLAKRWKQDTGEELSIDSPRAGQAIFSDLGSVPSS